MSITASRTAEEAVAQARRQSAVGPAFGEGECLYRVRLAFGVPVIVHDAAASWHASTRKHHETNPNAIPRGVPIFWLGGSHGFGHVAISAGDGLCWSTDVARTGYFDKVPIARIHARWGSLTLAGWTDDLNGVRVIVTDKAATPVTYGIDASHYQFDAGLKVSALKAQGYEFLALKCTQGATWYDKTYASALAQAKASGMLVLAYHFLEHGRIAAQAANLAAHITDHTVTVAIDCEPDGSSKPTMADVIAFRDACKALGLKVTVKYLPKWYWSQLKEPDLAGPLDLWASAYPSSAHDYGSRLYPGNTDSHWDAYGGQQPTLWQFTSTGKVDGFTGNVDVNAFRGSRAELAALGLFRDFSKSDPKPPTKPPPAVVPTTIHTHLQINVQRTMSKANVTADLARAFALSPDSIVFNEMETAWHHSEAQRFAAASGYTLFTPDGSAPGAVVVGVKNGVGTIVYEKSLLCAPGKKGLSPNRYFNRVQIVRADTHERIAIGGTQMWSSGWTGSTANDALRQARWYAHMAVMYPTFRRTAKHNHVAIGSGDLNRPPSSFPSGKVLGRMLNPKAMTSVGYAHTDATHGTTTFDYVWWASKRVAVTVKAWSTPPFHSDHDGVLVTLSWPTSTAVL